MGILAISKSKKVHVRVVEMFVSEAGGSRVISCVTAEFICGVVSSACL